MKNYFGQMIDLTGDSYLNPVPAIYDNGEHPRKISDIKSISIHHDASPRPHDYNSIDRYHKEAAEHYARLGAGLQYHFKIDNVGQIFQIRPLTTWLYCVGSAENVSTIAICLDGYLHNDQNNLGQDPTREQYEALGQLLTELCDNRPDFSATWSDVRPHLDFSSTACCGNRFAPWVLKINSKADALAIPENAVYDWASFQPDTKRTQSPPTPPTAPTVPPTTTTTPPPVVAPADQTHDLSVRVSTLEALVALILGYLRRLKSFNKFEKGGK